MESDIADLPDPSNRLPDPARRRALAGLSALSLSPWLAADALAETSIHALPRLALVVGCHRRKLKMDGLANILKIGGQRLMALCLILRLAVALHQARSDQALPEVTLRATNAQEWRLTIDASAEDWFMLAGVLEIEQAYQSGWGVGLSVKWALD